MQLEGSRPHHQGQGPLILGDRVVEIDIYGGRHKGLTVAEGEFNEEEEAKNFQPPEWLGDDVTGDPRYSNQLLAS